MFCRKLLDEKCIIDYFMATNLFLLSRVKWKCFFVGTQNQSTSKHSMHVFHLDKRLYENREIIGFHSLSILAQIPAMRIFTKPLRRCMSTNQISNKIELTKLDE